MSTEHTQQTLVEQFLAVFGEVPAGFERGEVGATLDKIWRGARQRWPDVSLDVQPFLLHLVQRLDPDQPVQTGLASLHTDDLYLSRAALAEDPQAIAAWRTHCEPTIRSAMRHIDSRDHALDEVIGELLEQLMVGGPGSEPRLAQYKGRGDLRSWVRVVTTRIALNLRRGLGQRPHRSESALADLASPGDLELDYLRQVYRAEFKESFLNALAQLTRKERLLLQHQVLDELSTAQIGALYSVHKATAARWLERIRQQLGQATRRALTAKLQVEPDELASIIRLVMSQFDASLRRVLNEEAV